MRLLMIQFVAPMPSPPLPCFRHDLGVLAALLTQEGITCRLASLPGYDPDALQAAIQDHQPTCALVDIHPYSVTAARRCIRELATVHRLPVVVCGQYATCGTAPTPPASPARG